jgi:TfoX/Sxy family transcriptional regulator of competence genes
MYYHIDGGREHGAGQLTSYIGRDDHQLRNRRGKKLGDDEREKFIERSQQYEYERQIIISPEHGDELSREQLSLGARRSMREFCRDRPSAEYVYAVHQDTEHPHAQIAVTGQKSDLWTDQDDLDRLKERAREQFRERQRARTRQRHKQRQQEREQQRERGPDRDKQRDRDRGRSRSGGRF